MAKKRGSGEGTVLKRKDGRWLGRISLGFDETGKRIQKTVYGKTQAEVNQKLDDLKQQRKHGAKAIVGKDTVGGYLQRWMDDFIALNRAKKTHQEYEGVIRLYIRPYIGQQLLVKIDGEALDAWQGKLIRKGVSNDIRNRTIKILRAALNRAVKLKLIPFNPCSSLEKPKITRDEPEPLEPEQCRDLFNACESHRLGDMVILAAMTGLRKGELFGLEWPDVNLNEGTLAVRRALQELKGELIVKEPKTKAGRRVVSLGVEAIEALARRKQKAIDEGFDPSAFPIVFPNTLGSHMRSSNFDDRVWYPIREAAGIPDSFVFHDLRHTQASLMLAAGVDLKVIQKRLGHRDFATTANTYSHLLKGAQNEAVSKMDELLKKRAPKLLPKSGEYTE
jgi:integrase